MFDNRKRKKERLNSGLSDSISANNYNLILGGTLSYGLIMNAILAYTATSFMESVQPFVFICIYFVCCIAGSLMTHMSHNPVVSFIGYNLIAVPIGLLLSLLTPFYSIDLILSAVLVTAAVTGAMMLLAVAFPNVFGRLGGALFIALLTGIIGELIASLLGYGGDIFNWFFVILFSLYIGYDWHKAQLYPKTIDNAIDSAVDLYLDVINLFIRILELLGKARSRD